MSGKRVKVLILSLLLAVSFMPAFSFAESEAENVPDVPALENEDSVSDEEVEADVVDDGDLSVDEDSDRSVTTDEKQNEDPVPAADNEQDDDAEDVETRVTGDPKSSDGGTRAGDEIIDSGTCGTNVTWTLTGTDTDMTLTISGTGNMSDLFSESSVPWASNRENIKSIIIEEGVKTIGSNAFYNCSSLTSIDIPDGVTSIGRGAFYGCSSLTSIDIPDSVTSIGSSAFSGCSNLHKVYITDLEQYINISFYYDNSSSPTCNGADLYINNVLAKEIMIPHGVTKIGAYAFYNCSSLTSVTIPDDVTSIGSSAFSGCSSLTSINIPDGVTTIGNYTFYNCSRLTSVTIPDSVTSIGSSAFSGCSSLTSIEIPDSVTTIGQSAFSGCSSLTNIELSNSVTSIDYATFDNCSKLTSITIPDSVTTIGENAFEGCSSLTNISIPDSVTSIGRSVFSGCSSLTSINIPGSVSKIGVGAFSGCSSLTSIEILNGVATIEMDAFRNCSSLTSINIPDSVSKIGRCAFSGCSSLTSIYIPASVTTIEEYAFDYCSSLTIYCGANSGHGEWNYGYVWNGIDNIPVNYSATRDDYDYWIALDKTQTSIEIPQYITIIPIGAFAGCSNLTSINIPESVNTVGARAFSDCSSLTSIYIPASVTSIGDSAFYNCSGLTSIEIPDSVTAIGKYAFYNCSGLTSIEIPDSVITIGERAFSGCSNLTSINIPDSVTTIGAYAFENCRSLKSIDIPDSVITIGERAFENCRNLTSIYIPDSVTTIGSLAFDNCQNLIIYCGASSEQGDANYGWRWNGNRPVSYSITKEEYYYWIALDKTQTSIEIPPYITSIPVRAFMDCSSLTSISIPDSVTTIDSSAFLGCISLTNVTIPDNVTTIGEHAFSGCSKLTSINIPDNVTMIGAYAFESCSKLTSINIPDSVPSIGSYTFSYCNSLTSINIPDSVTGIGSHAFNGCSSLTSINIPDGVTYIGELAFDSCSHLTSIYIPNSVTTISSGAVQRCSSSLVIYCGANSGAYEGNWHSGHDNVYYSITREEYDYWSTLDNTQVSIEIPPSITVIPANAFSGRRSLARINIPDGVTTIGSSAFNGCNKLTSINIPDSVTSIGSYAFSNCNSLTSINIPDSVTGIGSHAFSGCSGLTSIYIPDSVTSIGYQAFVNCSNNLVIYCGENSENNYDENWNYYHLVHYSINRNEYDYWSTLDKTLTSIEIPPYITIIPARAFNGCSSLTSINIPDSVTSIGLYAFDQCSSLISIEIPDSVTGIGSYAFRDCSSLTSIELPDGVTSIGYQAFYGCSSLTSIELPDGVTSIGYQAFYGCSSLTSIIIPDSVTTLGDEAFYNCSRLKSAGPIGSGCNIELGWAEEIPDRAFSSFNSLTSVIIPEGVSRIGDSAFSGCSNLTSIIIPNSVTFIHSSICRDCNRLTSVTYEGTRREWDAIELQIGNNILINKLSVLYYSINYELNGGDSNDKNPSKGLKSGDVVILKDPVRAGYIFGGWYDSADFANRIDTVNTNDDEITVYAKWNIPDYEIHYELDGGINNDSNPSSYNGESDTIILQDPTKDYYVFEGWYNDPEFSDKVETIDPKTCANITIYAKWRPLTFSINYELNGGENNAQNPSEYNCESGTIILMDPTSEENVFLGWYTDSGFMNKIEEIPAGSTGDIILYAKWDVDTVTITYELSGGINNKNNAPSVYRHNLPYDLCDPIKENWAFAGWFTSPDFEESSRISAIPVGCSDTLTLYAKWGEIPVESLEISPKSTTVDIGKSIQLAALLQPNNASDKSLVWTSSNPSIASVSQEGIVSGETEGEATITVKTKDGKLSDSCEVSVYDRNSREEFTRIAGILQSVGSKTGNSYLVSDSNDSYQRIIIYDPVNSEVLFMYRNRTTGGRVDFSFYGSQGIGGIIDAKIIFTNSENVYCSTLTPVSVRTYTPNTRLEHEDDSMTNNYRNYADELFLESLLAFNNTLALKTGGRVNIGSFGFDALMPILENHVGVTSVNIEQTSCTLEVDDSYELNYAILPSNTSDSHILWESSDHHIAKVDDFGVVTGQKPGTATIMAVSGLDGTKKDTCKVTVLPRDISKGTIEKIPDAAYTGSPITPEPVVKYGDWTLTEGVNYTVSYTDNINSGTATIIITGKSYFGGTLQSTFKINKASLSEATVSGLNAKTYTGKAITQTPVVKVGSITLKSGTDYTLSYKNNVKPGIATIIITGKGNYSGAVSRTFEIVNIGIKSLWASEHSVGKVKFKWTKLDGTTVTGWNLKYRTRKIGAGGSWSGWTTKSYPASTYEAWINIPVDYVIEIHAQAKGDKTWSTGIITTPAGGKYQAMKTTYVLNTATKKRVGTSLTMNVGETIKVRPDYEYPVKDYNKRPKLYPNQMLYDVSDKTIITITKPDGSKYTGGMIDGVATIKATKKGKTQIVFRAPNGRTQVTQITVN